MTDNIYNVNGVTVRVPDTVDGPDGALNEIAVLIDGVMVIRCRLSFENLAELQGQLDGGVRTSAVVYDAVIAALDYWTEDADRVKPMEV